MKIGDLVRHRFDDSSLGVIRDVMTYQNAVSGVVVRWIAAKGNIAMFVNQTHDHGKINLTIIAESHNEDW
jgi:hypothetical protein